MVLMLLVGFFCTRLLVASATGIMKGKGYVSLERAILAQDTCLKQVG